jgi:phosphohistidine phosphatase
MKKTLILIRHSKAENRDSTANDFDRTLTAEGKSDSLRMADYLKNNGIAPDLIITSSAARAYETAMVLANTFSTSEKSISSTKKLYYCSAKTILDQLFGLGKNLNCVIVVAHNPGISDLTRGLSEGHSFFMDNTQVSFMEFNIEHWYQIGDIKPAKFESYSLKNIG